MVDNNNFLAAEGINLFYKHQICCSCNTYQNIHDPRSLAYRNYFAWKWARLVAHVTKNHSYFMVLDITSIKKEYKVFFCFKTFNR